MEAIILAGGYGTRLQSVIKDIPKPMVDINGRPFLSYLVDHLSCQNIRKILLSVGYKHEIIKNYFGLRYKNLDIEYVIEDKPLGTGGAIKEALKWVEGDDVVVLNGDTFFYLELKKLIEFHLAQDAILTIAVKLMHNFDRYGTVVLKEGKIINFEEKTFKAAGYINGGVYVVKKAIFKSFDMKRDKFSFEMDFLHKNIEKIKPIAFSSNSYFIDIGIPEDYKKAQKEIGLIFSF